MMVSPTRSKLTVARGIAPDSDGADIHNAVPKWLAADDPDSQSNNKTASRTATDPRFAMAQLVEQRVRVKGCSFAEALNQIKADPKYRALTEQVHIFFNPNLRAR